MLYYLQEGVSFHDGEPFNAESCKVNLEYYKENPNGGFLRGFTAISSIDIVDEYTLVLHYTTPYYAYLYTFTEPDVFTMVSPNVLEDGNYDSMKGIVGTGPYKFFEAVPGEYTRFVRNEEYWGEKPQFDEIMAKYIPEASSRLQALQTGEIDMIYGEILLSYDDYQQALTLPNVKGQVSKVGSKTRNIVANASSEMLSDQRVREAIAYGINKDELAQGLTNGSESAATMLFPEGIPYTDVELDIIRTYNLDKANVLLEEAGWVMNTATGIREKGGIPLQLTLIYEQENALNPGIAAVLKSQLASCGIDVMASGMEQMQWWQLSVEGKFDLCLWYAPLPQDSPFGYYTPILDNQTAAAASIRSLSDADDFLSAITQTTVTDDPSRVTELMTFILNYDNNNVIDIPLSYSKDMILYNRHKFDHYTFTGIPRFFDASGLEFK